MTFHFFIFQAHFATLNALLLPYLCKLHMKRFACPYIWQISPLCSFIYDFLILYRLPNMPASLCDMSLLIQYSEKMAFGRVIKVCLIPGYCYKFVKKWFWMKFKLKWMFDKRVPLKKVHFVTVWHFGSCLDFLILPPQIPSLMPISLFFQHLIHICQRKKCRTFPYFPHPIVIRD